MLFAKHSPHDLVECYARLQTRHGRQQPPPIARVIVPDMAKGMRADWGFSVPRWRESLIIRVAPYVIPAKAEISRW